MRKGNRLRASPSVGLSAEIDDSPDANPDASAGLRACRSAREGALCSLTDRWLWTHVAPPQHRWSNLSRSTEPRRAFLRLSQRCHHRANLL